MATVTVACKVVPRKDRDEVFSREYEVETGEKHLKSLSSTLKVLQKEVNDSLTTIVEREKKNNTGSVEQNGMNSIYTIHCTCVLSIYTPNHMHL